MKRQYGIMSADGKFLTGNVYATRVVDAPDPDRWQLYIGEEFVGTIWKKQAILDLCYHEYAEAAAEAHYPIIAIEWWRQWPIRTGVAVAAGSVGRSMAQTRIVRARKPESEDLK